MFISRELQAFISVYEAGSVKRSAEKLHVTAPAISRMLKKIEASIEKKLFIFKNGKMEATRVADYFYEDVISNYRDIVAAEELLKRGYHSVRVYIDPACYFFKNHLQFFFYQRNLDVSFYTSQDSSNDFDIEIHHTRVKNTEIELNIPLYLIRNTASNETYIPNYLIHYMDYIKGKFDNLEIKTESNDDLLIYKFAFGEVNLIIPCTDIFAQLASSNEYLQTVVTDTGIKLYLNINNKKHQDIIPSILTYELNS